MAFSQDYLDKLETKEEVIEYAASFGVTGLIKKRKLETLKKDVREALDIPAPSLFEALEHEVVKGVAEELAPTADGENVTVKLKGEVVATFPIAALESWCITTDVDYRAVKGMVGLTHLHHNFYTFHKS